MFLKDLNKKVIGIYKINFPNGKVYIGMSNDIKRRLKEHYRDDRYIKYPCYNALKKYYKNIELLEFDILETLEEENYTLLNEKEKFWIKYYKSNSRDRGYNLTEGGISLEGVANPFSSFTEKEIEFIQKKLIEGWSNKDLAKNFNCHPDTIGRINQGKNYYNNKLDYPLRDNTKRQCVASFSNHNSISKDCFMNIIQDLQAKKMTIKEIADKYSLHSSTISNINQGRVHKQSNLSYPIQIFKNNKKITKDNLLIIYDLLINSNLSINKIAEKVKCSKDTIQDINQGKRKYCLNQYYYPIRKNKEKNKHIQKSVSTILESEE